MVTVTIRGDFPGLNEYIAAIRASRGKWNKGNDMKRRDQASIKAQLPRIRYDGPMQLKYRFYCKDRRRDLDNISGYFHKIFQDAMVERGIIPDDGWRYIRGFSDEFVLDRNNPRIEVDIVEAGDAKL